MSGAKSDLANPSFASSVWTSCLVWGQRDQVIPCPEHSKTSSGSAPFAGCAGSFTRFGGKHGQLTKTLCCRQHELQPFEKLSHTVQVCRAGERHWWELPGPRRWHKCCAITQSCVYTAGIHISPVSTNLCELSISEVPTLDPTKFCTSIGPQQSGSHLAS